MSTEWTDERLTRIILDALSEDIGDGDHSSLACIPHHAKGEAKLLVKQPGIIAGVELAKQIFSHVDNGLLLLTNFQDGDDVHPGDVVFRIQGSARSILTAERLILNCMQRMSGIATMTRSIVDRVKHTRVKILDTRKTTPGLRVLEKWAVRIGGGYNHRFGLFDMIMLKDNHIDFSGGITQAVTQTLAYLNSTQKQLSIEVEVRNKKELMEAISLTGIDRIMLDNFTPAQISEVLPSIPIGLEVEASGGITTDSIVAYAETGVHYISVGALTHSVKSLDLSLKAVIN
jgi:nicotinate-nucleotide pyrophosphorylase (carboxylating)